MRKSALLLSGLAAPALIHNAAYANTLTNLIPQLYAALDVVSRELVGFIPSVNMNTGVERAAVGQSVYWPVAPIMTAVDTTPAMQIPEPTDRVVGSDFMQITKARNINFGWVGEEQVGLNHGPGTLTVQGGFFAQALRALVNEIEADIATAAAVGASRAYGTAGTSPFAPGATGNVGDSAQIRKILDDNGADPSERSLVIDTSAGANLRTLYQLTRANEAGTTMTLRDGELLQLHNMSVKESGQIQSPVAGTAASATTDATGYAVGATTITLASAGTGEIKAGDIVTFAGDANKYVVATGDANVAGGGSIVLVAPGLRKAIAAAATNITVVATASRSVAFPRSAIALAARPSALPTEGDAAIDSFMLTDPRSGMPFEVRLYAGYRKIRAEVGMAWGVKVVKKEHVALLLG